MRSARRESEAQPRGSISGDLLGKFSAIVRRGSHLLGANNNNNSNDCGGVGGDPFYDSGSGDYRETMTSISPQASIPELEPLPQSMTHANKGFGFNFTANMRRFSKTSTADGGADGGADRVTRMMSRDEPERHRRCDVEGMEFALLHEHFQPAVTPEIQQGGGRRGEEEDATMADNQVEEELQRTLEEEEEVAIRRKSREMTVDAEEYEVNDREMLGRMASASLEDMEDDNDQDIDDDGEEDEVYDVYGDDHGEDEDEEEGEDSDNNEAELNFDQANLGASVRKLVLQIKSASMRGGAALISNQENDQAEDDMEDREEEDETDAVINGERRSDPFMGMKPPRRVTYPMAMAPNNSRALAQSCYIPMDEVQEDLTQSVRRLVIGLQQDSEDAAAVGADKNTKGGVLPFSRRRGNSCPPPYRPSPQTFSKKGALLPPSHATTSLTPFVVAETAPPATPPRWRKRSTLARLAPKLFDHFRRKRTSYLYTDEELESIEGARWKIVELAFRFGGKHRLYLVQAVNMFFPLTKFGRHGGPHATRLHCNRCGTLQWQHKRGGLSEPVDLADVLQVLEGRQTAVFCKYPSTSEQLHARSLSLVFKHRTLDLETQSASHRDWLMSALRTLVTYARKQREAEQRAIAERALLLLPLEEEETEELRQRHRRHERSLTETQSATGHRASIGPMLLW